MSLIDDLEKCLRFDKPNILESESEKLIRKAIDKLRKYKTATSGWSGYAWKDGEYIDNIQEYFDENI